MPTILKSKNLTFTHIYLVILLLIFIHFFQIGFHNALTSLLICNFFNLKSYSTNKNWITTNLVKCEHMRFAQQSAVA